MSEKPRVIPKEIHRDPDLDAESAAREDMLGFNFKLALSLKPPEESLPKFFERISPPPIDSTE